ncbi:MAG: protein-L-isoaspartate(D-aspartate) O-methyltransferase [Planctomycetaceae bacterium]
MRIPASLQFLLIALISGTIVTSSVYGQSDKRYEAARLKMVKEYIEKEGVTNEAVLKSMRTVPRHHFVRPADRKYAYYDTALPIGYKQTISPPYIVAYMTQTIDPQPDEKVLEIGTGSGYQAAVLSSLAKEVYSIEIVPQLGKAAGKRLKRLGYKNVTTKVDDGFKGWKEHAPFDKIIVTCSPEKIPQPLIDQLKEGGKMLIPLGERYQQVFHLLEKKDGKLLKKRLVPTLFVPMTGISEDKREVKPDPTKPKIINGSFEIDANKDGRPDNWHYQRQLTYESQDSADGSRHISLQNDEAGRLSQLLQGLALDGRSVKKIQISVSLRYQRAALGIRRNDIPAVLIHFFDINRKSIGVGGIGPILGSNRNWTRYRKTITVPRGAREAVIQIGLNGGTGKMEVDDFSLVPIK